MMKTGFTSLVCPDWDLETLVTNASSMGFDGVELRGLRGDLNLPFVPELSADPPAVRRLFAEKNVELVCLGCSATLDSRDRRTLARQKAALTETIELAAQLGCPYVRIHAGEVQRWDHRRAALSRIAAACSSMAVVASRYDVTLLIENGGDFPGSEDIWFLLDAAGHPCVQSCWNQCNAMSLGEHPTTSIPRLGRRIGMVHVCDAEFDEQGVLLEYSTPGTGHVGVTRQIELLKGLVYDHYLMFDWPKLWIESLPAPESILPDVAKYLRGRVDAKQPILTAYKGDKRAPTFAAKSAG